MLSSVAIYASLLTSGQVTTPIDRFELVTRHNIELHKFSSRMPLQIGNGSFAFSFDITGLQTFTPFNTLSQWGWKSSPMPVGSSQRDFRGQVWPTHGRDVRYPMPDPDHPQLSQWMASNPHRINLGRIGFTLRDSRGVGVSPVHIKNAQQTLDLWTGITTSRFVVDGFPVVVKTAADPATESIAVQVFSALVRNGQLSVFFSYPGDDPQYFAQYVGDQNSPEWINIETSGFRKATLTDSDPDTQRTMNLRWETPAKLTRVSKTPQKLSIPWATYWAVGKSGGMVENLSWRIKDNRLTVRPAQDLNDPAPGKAKLLEIRYQIGNTIQAVSVDENQEISIAGTATDNRIVLTPELHTGPLMFTCTFAPEATEAPTVDEVFARSKEAWPKFWESGGAIDLSGSSDPRWKELERRIVLSQYLMKVNESGNLPPQESGLVNNSWYGKFHMEMLLWHSAHWALWNRWSPFYGASHVYARLLPSATARAKSQGYAGARWPKALGPTLVEWPDIIHALLIWQQPHPIFFAELDYRAHPSKATLLKWAPIIEATADFMASYAQLNPETKLYDLGPPLVPVSENLDPKFNRNPTFELSYWRTGLRLAIQWQNRLGKQVNPKWDKVLNGLAPLPQRDGNYLLSEGVFDMWTKLNYEHPALIGAYGLLPGDGVDHKTMRDTFELVMKLWNFDRVWGWDFPMLAMTAARLNQPERALDLLLTDSPNFQFDAAGLASGGPYPYFPSNGGLLYTVAMMAAGWDGSPDRHAPGFPGVGWNVKFENISPAP